MRLGICEAGTTRLSVFKVHCDVVKHGVYNEFIQGPKQEKKRQYSLNLPMSQLTLNLAHFAVSGTLQMTH